MDISRSRFPFELVKIVQLIADSHFVAFDLEFSGIAGRRKDRKKATLQEVYEDVKEAAQRYQVLQVGLTVVEEDLVTGRYLTRPYNFNINPIPATGKLHFERIWSFQSGAVDFLLKNGFAFELPYTHGIPYLSIDDEDNIKAAWTARDSEKAALSDMPIKEEDEVLINHVRDSVEQWQTEPVGTRDGYLNIPNTSPGGPRFTASQTLNRYQVRLVHQIVRNEYPKLKTSGKGHFVQLTAFDSTKEVTEKLQQAHYRDIEIARAVEFRWLIEAISGGDITKMPSEYFATAFSSDATPPVDEPGGLKKFIDKLQEKLSTRRRILIGHNCFTDLVYLYACFFGQLPEKVQDFQKLIRERFPAVVDTKFIASFGSGWHSTSLQDVGLDLNTYSTDLPMIETPVEFDRYAVGERLHEAGYDSLLTARIAIQLSAKLEKEGKFPAYRTEEDPLPSDEDVSEHYSTAPESISDVDGRSLAATITDVLSTPVIMVTSFLRNDLASTGQQFGDSTQQTDPSDQPEDLMVFSDDNESESLDEHDLLDARSQEDVSTAIGDSAASPKFDTPKPLTKAEILEKIKTGKMMPLWEGGRGFWQYFGNKLQVNSCEEGICYL